jgi:perosamine synthetase
MLPRRIIEVFRPVIYEDSIRQAVRTLRSGWIGAGPKIKEFEEKFSKYVGSRYCVAVNSGTSALHIAIRCLDLPKRGRIITTPITHVSTIHPIFYEGAIPVFADVERRIGNISPESIKKRLKKNAKGILCTHLGGYPCDLDALREISDNHGVQLLEDCTHALGSSYKGRRIGSGNLCCFSFSFPKAVTGIEGGAIVTNDAEYAERARALRNLGMERGRENTIEGSQRRLKEIGFRYNWNDVMASIALKQMEHLERDNQRRRQLGERYISELAGREGVYLPEYRQDRTSSYFFVPLFFDRRNDLARKLRLHGIQTRIYFRNYNAYNVNARERLPNAEWYSRHELTLPINVYLTDEDVDYILTTIKSGW